ncbi:MAG: DoxX family protein [Deltaproteobacteria bacterium]
MPRKIALLVVSAFFSFAGITHFTNTAFFLAIVPPYLPAHLELVYTSGVFEVMGGVGVLLPAWRKAAGYGLIALLVAVYPANIHMALNPDLFPDMTATALYVRLPLQFVMGWLVWWATRAESIS